MEEIVCDECGESEVQTLLDGRRLQMKHAGRKTKKKFEPMTGLICSRCVQKGMRVETSVSQASAVSLSPGTDLLEM